MDVATVPRAPADERRLQILAWPRPPCAHLSPQGVGDSVEDGVCGVFLADDLGASPPTPSEHMRGRVGAGLVVPKRVRGWTFYERGEARIRAAVDAIRDGV